MDKKILNDYIDACEVVKETEAEIKKLEKKKNLVEENMANVCCTSNTSFSVNKDEKEVLQKAHDIIEEIRHDWFIKDDNAWDDEGYWEIDNTVKMLERLFGCKNKY